MALTGEFFLNPCSQTSAAVPLPVAYKCLDQARQPPHLPEGRALAAFMAIECG